MLGFSNPGVSFECKNCTVTGTIDILQGSVSGNATTPGPADNADEGFSWDSGSFKFAMNGFSAHMELGATIEPSLGLVTYNAPMPSIGLPGFKVSPRSKTNERSELLIPPSRYLE